MRGRHCLNVTRSLHFHPLPFFLLFAASAGTTSVRREATRLPRRWQRTRPSQPSSAFIHPQALAVFESATLFGMRGGHCLNVTRTLTFILSQALAVVGSAIFFSSLDTKRTLFKCYKDAYTFHPFFFFFFQPWIQQARSRGRQSAC